MGGHLSRVTMVGPTTCSNHSNHFSLILLLPKPTTAQLSAFPTNSLAQADYCTTFTFSNGYFHHSPSLPSTSVCNQHCGESPLIFRFDDYGGCATLPVNPHRDDPCFLPCLRTTELGPLSDPIIYHAPILRPKRWEGGLTLTKKPFSKA